MKSLPVRALGVTVALAALGVSSTAPGFAVDAAPNVPVAEPAPIPTPTATPTPVEDQAPTPSLVQGEKDPNVVGDVTVTPMAAYPGEKVRVSGECRFYGNPGTSLSIGLAVEGDSRPFEFAPEITMDDGTFDVEVALPLYTPPGAHELRWACSLNDAVFELAPRGVMFTVLGDPPTSNAASTSTATASSSASASASSDAGNGGTGSTATSDGRGTANPTTPAPSTPAPTKPAEELAETGTNASGAVAIAALAGAALGAGLLLRRRRKTRA